MTRPRSRPKRTLIQLAGALDDPLLERVDLGPIAPVPVVSGPSLGDPLDRVDPSLFATAPVVGGPAQPGLPVVGGAQPLSAAPQQPGQQQPGQPVAGGKWVTGQKSVAAKGPASVLAPLPTPSSLPTPTPTPTPMPMPATTPSAGPKAGPKVGLTFGTPRAKPPGPARPGAPLPTGPAPAPLAAPVRKDELAGKIGIALRDYYAEKDPQKKLILLDIVLGASEYYLGGRGQRSVRVDSVTGLIEDIFAEASRDHSRLLAQAQYAADAHQTSGPSMYGNSTKLTGQKQGDVAKVLGGAKALGAGQTTAAFGGGATDASLDLVQKYGLSGAEILAIRTYTAADYEYINPATANSESWLTQQNPGAPDLKSLREEGSLHAGVAMMGLEKLPKMAGLVYRGARMTEKEFTDLYPATVTFNAFTSTSTARDAAENFANGQSGNPPAADQTVYVMGIFQVTNARNIKDLSLFAKENEWLLLPGATFTRTKVEEVPPARCANRAAPRRRPGRSSAWSSRNRQAQAATGTASLASTRAWAPPISIRSSWSPRSTMRPWSITTISGLGFPRRVELVQVPP